AVSPVVQQAAVPAAEPVPAPVQEQEKIVDSSAEETEKESSRTQTQDAVVEEPKQVLLWRQGRFEGRNRNQDQNRQRNNRARPEADKVDAEGGSEQRGKRFDRNKPRPAGENQAKREGFKGKSREGGN